MVMHPFVLLLLIPLTSALTITSDPTVVLNKPWDYIIAGGGTSGVSIISFHIPSVLNYPPFQD